MTSDAVPTGADPRRLLADARGLARRVRVAQRVTWLPLLVLGVVVLGAIPAYRWAPEIVSDCKPIGDGQTCHFWMWGVQLYWLLGLAVGYLVIVAGYRRVARDRGLGTRIQPYAITGVGLVVLFTATYMLLDRLGAFTGMEMPGQAMQMLFRLTDFTGTIGLALLVLAWLERHLALLLFALVYLLFVLVPINFGWGTDWGNRWGAAPMLVITAGVLLLGSAGFALAQRRNR